VEERHQSWWLLTIHNPREILGTSANKGFGLTAYSENRFKKVTLDQIKCFARQDVRDVSEASENTCVQHQPAMHCLLQGVVISLCERIF
jgi:hypothetical protein